MKMNNILRSTMFALLIPMSSLLTAPASADPLDPCPGGESESYLIYEEPNSGDETGICVGYSSDPDACYFGIYSYWIQPDLGRQGVDPIACIPEDAGDPPSIYPVGICPVGTGIYYSYIDSDPIDSNNPGQEEWYCAGICPSGDIGLYTYTVRENEEQIHCTVIDDDYIVGIVLALPGLIIDLVTNPPI